MFLQILMITPIIVHTGIFIGEVFGWFTGVGVAKMFLDSGNPGKTCTSKIKLGP